MEIICPNGLKGGVRLGLGDSVIRLGLKAQRVGIPLACTTQIPQTKEKETKNIKKKKRELMKKRTNKQDYSNRSGIHGFPTGLCPSVGVGGHISGDSFGNSPIT